MKSRRTYLSIPLALVLITGVYAATTGASLLGSDARSTVAPAAYYAGTNTADTLTGTNANDVLVGRGGPDTLHGRGGNDVLQGGAGNDRLYGGPGRDSLDARDNRRDTVNGGPGFDEAWVDRLDRVRNVERVHRV
jgi:Ca2+-binding RTX toxin-like protein